jgi:hypothetical protein
MTLVTRTDQAEDQANSYSRGILSTRETVATRTAYYYSDDMSAVGLKAAVDAMVTAEGTTHPNNSLLPLRQAQGVRIFPHVVKVYLRYGYGQGSVPVATSDELTKSDSGYATFKSWHKNSKPGSPNAAAFDSKGRPKGPLNFPWTSSAMSGLTADEKYRLPPLATYIQVPFQTVRIQTVLSTNPTNAVIGYLGKLNSDSVTYAGKTYEERSIQFQRLLVDPIEEDNGDVKYRVEYTMAFRRSHWVVELEPKWSGSAWAEDPDGMDGSGDSPDNPWYALMAPEVAFSGNFPVHA